MEGRRMKHFTFILVFGLLVACSHSSHPMRMRATLYTPNPPANVPTMPAAVPVSGPTVTLSWIDSGEGTDNKTYQPGETPYYDVWEVSNGALTLVVSGLTATSYVVTPTPGTHCYVSDINLQQLPTAGIAFVESNSSNGWCGTVPGGSSSSSSTGSSSSSSAPPTPPHVPYGPDRFTGQSP